MAHLLSGVHEQNFIAHAMAYASCVGDYANKCDRRAPVGQNLEAKSGANTNMKPHLALSLISIVLWIRCVWKEYEKCMQPEDVHL